MTACSKNPEVMRPSQVAALDYMIEKGHWYYWCDPWCRDPDGANYSSIAEEGLSGQVNYKGEIFLVVRTAAIHGRGGMDEGRPAGAKIYRIEAEAVSSMPIVWSNNVADPLGTMKMADYARYRALLEAMKVGRFEISPIMSGEQVVAFSISPLPKEAS